MTKRLLVAKTIIVNEHGEMLVVHRGEWKEHPERAHQADLPGGQADGDENEREAAIREIKEETGVTVKTSDLKVAYTGTVFYEEDDLSVNRILFVVYLDHTPEISLSWEHESFDWLKPEEAAKTKKFSGFYSEAIKYVVENNLI